MILEIRPLTRRDSEEIMGLVANIENEVGLSAAFYWPQEELQNEIWTTEGWGVFQNGQLAAFVLYRQTADIWEVTILATAPRERRQRLMERLLSELINAKNHQGEIWLEVHEDNLPAQKLYEKLGFSQVGARPKYYRDGARALLYSYQLEIR